MSYSIRDGVTQSLLTSWCACRQRARYYLDGWRLRRTKDSLAFGSFVHFLLEQLYNGIRSREVRQPGDAVDLFRDQSRIWRGKQDQSASQAVEQTERCIAVASVLFPEYCHFHKQDFKPGVWIKLEGVFDRQWHGFRLRGRWDGLRRVKGKYWLLETKTKSRIEDDRISKGLALNFQNLFYITACEKPITGVLYNIIRNPGQKRKQDESLGEYCKRIALDVHKRPEHYFMRYEVFYPMTDQARFQRDLLLMLREFEAWHQGDMPTYRMPACVGQWNCEYIDACTSGTDVEYERDGTLFQELED